MDIISDATVQVDGHDAVVINPAHERWTATIEGASWIWENDGSTTNPTADEEKTFSASFTPPIGVISAILHVAADNGVRARVNAVEVINLFTEEFNYQTVATTPIIPMVSNTIAFDVKNFAMSGSNWTLNPAGIIFGIEYL